MSRKRKPPHYSPLRDLAGQLRGRRIYGGCDHCNAYQTVEEDPDFPAITHLYIHHDHWCPWLARMEVN
jgi:hypothetical protein